ncbi:MAG: VanZ family protein [Bacilli bacterium]
MMNFFRKNIKWILLGFFVLLNIFIILESTISGEISGEQSSQFSNLAAEFINTLKPETINFENVEQFHGFIRKFFGHFLLFFGDGLLGFFTFHLLLKEKPLYVGFSIASACGLFIAVSSELIQLLIPERAGLLTDVLIDLLGYMIPLLLGYLIILIIDHRKNKSSQISE